MSKRTRLILAIVLAYLTYGLLLNTVGTAILRAVASLGVTKSEAGWFDGCKDVSVALVSLFTASYLPRLGLKRAMLIGLGLSGMGCVAMRLVPGYATVCLHFVLLGASFALIKVCVYALIGQASDDAPNYSASHAGLTSMVEGGFMIGVLGVALVFSPFVSSGLVDTSRHWLDAYWLLAGLCALSFAVVATAPIAEDPARADAGNAGADAPGMADMFRLVRLPLVLVFILCAFTYVFIEQGIGTWLPTFTNEVLHMPQNLAVLSGSLYAGAIALGRLAGGGLIRRFGWYPVINACLIGVIVAVLAIAALSHQGTGAAVNDWTHAPPAAWVFLILGLFLAPIYPTVVSVLLTSSPPSRHTELMGLVVIFSALGGTTGSRLTAILFSTLDGPTAFGTMALPALVLIVGVAQLRKHQMRVLGKA